MKRVSMLKALLTHKVTDRVYNKLRNKYPYIFAFRYLVVKEHICPFCGRKFKSYGAILSHLNRSPCAYRLNDILKSVIYDNRFEHNRVSALNEALQNTLARTLSSKIIEITD